MDPLTLIVTALVAGASAAAKDTAGKAVKDAYDGLKALIQKRFAGKPEAESALPKLEKPQAGDESLKKALDQAGAAEDEAILKKAQELLAKADPEGAARNEYTVIFHGKAIGVQTGDYNTQTLNIGKED